MGASEGLAAIGGGDTVGSPPTSDIVGLDFTSDDPAAIEEAGRRHADGCAFTFGAMGSSKKNFYHDAFARQGYGDDVAEVQRLVGSR